MEWSRPTLAYEHQDFLDKGYSFLGKVLTAEGLSLARENLDRMIAELHPTLKADEIYSAHQQERWILEIAISKPILDVIEQQIGPDIVLWSTHLICKAPHTGRPVPWHQDKTYWNTSQLGGSVWLAFDDVDVDNGTMFVLPEWHKRKDLPRQKTDNELFEEEIAAGVLPANINELEVGYRLQAGEGAIHDPLIPHRSTPNQSDRWRRVLVCRYMSAGGDMAGMEYPHYRTAEPFPRRYLLVRGEDTAGRGLERV